MSKIYVIKRAKIVRLKPEFPYKINTMELCHI